MFFTSCIIIAFFCFAFYLIWNQFLKKDTRLSTGLKVLRKKISELQNLSLSVETQVDRHNSVVNDKIQRMEYLLKKTTQLCLRMEHNIKIATALTNKDLTNKDLTNKDLTNKDLTNKDLTNKDLTNKDLTNKDLTNKGHEGQTDQLDKTEPVSERESRILKPNFKNKQAPPDSLEKSSSPTVQALHLKMVREKPVQPKQLYFGDSPFVKMGFVEPPEKDKKHPDPAL